jgi:hypothetical protein
MVATITPVGHGGRRVGWAAGVALHAGAAGTSAALLGSALGGLGLLLGAPWGGPGLLLVALVALAYGSRELLGVPVPLPEARRQVPEWWRTAFAPPVTAALYGFGLGVGFLTHLRHGTLVAVGAAAVVMGDPVLGAALIAPFGIVRGLTAVTAGGGTTSERVGRAVARLEDLGATRWPQVVNGAVLVALGVVALRTAPIDARELAGPAAAVLALAFGWAAVAKAARPRAWRAALRAHLGGRLERAASVAVPLAEAAVPVLVVGGHPALGGTLALALLATFSLATLRARRIHGTRVPCGCFGRTRSIDYRVTLLRNAALAVAATLTLGADPGGGLALRAPSSSEILPAALAAVGLAVGVWAVVRSARWLGRGAAR